MIHREVFRPHHHRGKVHLVCQPYQRARVLERNIYAAHHLVAYEAVCAVSGYIPVYQMFYGVQVVDQFHRPSGRYIHAHAVSLCLFECVNR